MCHNILISSFTYYNKTDGLTPNTKKPTGHNSGKTQSAFAQTTIP